MYARTESETFWDSVDLLSKRLGRDASARDAIETHIAERGLRGAPRDGSARSCRPRSRPPHRAASRTSH